MSGERKKGGATVVIGGITYQQSYINGLKRKDPAAYQALVGSAGSTGTTGTTVGGVTMPTAAQLRADGVPAALAKQYGGKAFPLPAAGLNGSTISITSGIKEGLAALPQSVSDAVMKFLGLNDARLGRTLDERIAAVLPVLQAAKGEIGSINLNRALNNDPSASVPKRLSTYAATFSAAPSAAIPAAAKTLMDGVLKKIGAPIDAVTVGAMTKWLENEQGGPGLPDFVANQGNPFGIQTPAAQAAGKAGNLQDAINLTAQELTQNYGGIVAAFRDATSIDAIGTQIVDSPWNGSHYGGLASFLNPGASGSAPLGNGQPAIVGSTPYEQYSSIANADNILMNWGIDTPEMNALVNRLVAHGVINQNQILQNIRQTATYRQAFPGLAEYNSRPGQIHMTESEYRTYSQSIQSAAQQFGGVRLNQNQIATLLNGNVSASEFQQRVQDIGVAVQNADAGTKAILQKEYGINPAHLFAYYANPKETLPDMQRAVASGEIQDYANRVGLGGLTEAQGNQLAQMAKLSATQGNNPLGVGVTNIEGSLLTASKDAPLTVANPGEGRPTVNTSTLIGSQLAGFGGTNQVADQTAVERAAQARVAPFEKGGGYEQDTRGVTGVGSAKS